MARQRSPDRDKAFEIYKTSEGKKPIVDIAKELGISSVGTVRGWKNKDEWDDRLNGTFHKKEKKNVPNNTERSIKKRGAPKGNKNALNNRGGAKKGNKNAVGNSGGAAPIGNSNATTHGLFRKYLPEEVYRLKEELESAVANDPLAILWENIMLQFSNIIYAQRIMFVQDKSDMTKELKKHKVGENGFEEEWEIQFAWDKQANFLNAHSRALATLASLIKDFDRLAHIDDERRAKLNLIQAQIDKLKSTTNTDTTVVVPVQFIDNITGDLDD
ncbi:terminase [Bacillus manliponensis]|uniref:Terminase n=1 Tax=Bacillus manliponensis TaxID=574376 RepID=A0A073K4H4_9BACI|nr:phage terminase small subunit [Bacillus manliponensis]KEK17193.1 terminase [Bacillus manliponensis]